MTVDLMYLTWAAAITGVMWMPHITARALVIGPAAAAGYPDELPELPKWIGRAIRAHANMVENLPVFGALVVVAHLGGMAGETTALGAAIFFWFKMVHIVVHFLGIPWLRTLAFLGAWIGNVVIFLAIVGLA